MMNMLVYGFIGMIALYLARAPMRALIASVCEAVAKGFRFASRSVIGVRARLVARNREVLLSTGRDAAARMVEREFERFGDTVRRDLSQYPALHQTLTEQARKLDEDYAASTAAP